MCENCVLGVVFVFCFFGREGVWRVWMGCYDSCVGFMVLEGFQKGFWKRFQGLPGKDSPIPSGLPKNENAKHPVQLILTAQVFLFRGTFVETSTRPSTGSNKQ